MRAADDFEAIRARLAELRRERDPARLDKDELNRSRERIVIDVKPTVVFRKATAT